MASKDGGQRSHDAQQSRYDASREKADVRPGGQGRVKDPSTDRRLKQNREKHG